MMWTLAEKAGLGVEKEFRWRGGEVSRIEGFSDAVFAFSVTLLVVSLEVPKTFNDLMMTMLGVPLLRASLWTCVLKSGCTWIRMMVRYSTRYQDYRDI